MSPVNLEQLSIVQILKEIKKTIYSANIKRDKKNFHKFCPAEVNDSNKHFLKSIEGVELIVSDYVATCKTAKSVLKNGVGTDSVSITDFKKL